jgi:EAL domain-containing protein (putative c-di-GMP-specific phosphodiesterase class I)
LPSPDHLPRLDWLAVLQRTGLDPRRIVIEVTEGLLLHATPNVTERISTLARRMHLAAQAAARKGRGRGVPQTAQ